MRKLIKLAFVVLGIRTLLRWRKRRSQEQTAPTISEQQADPADELRRKLADSRDDVPDEAAEPPAAPVSDRRAEVHDQGRATLDEMKSSDES